MVKTAIETYGSQATETTVLVDSVQIVLKDGSGAIRGLKVGNPQGFATPLAFSLGEVATQIDLKSLSEEVTVIEHIIVQAPQVFFELNAAGKNNLAVLKHNLSSISSGPSASASTNQDIGAEPKFIIRKLLFADGNIHARAVALNKDYELKLPMLEMNNLGGKNGATPQQIAAQVLKTLTERALVEVQRQGINQYKEQFEGKINQQLEAEKEQINDKLQGLFNY